MSMMDDYHRTLSRHLCDVLDRIGLSTDDRETIMNTSLTTNILLTLSLELTGEEQVCYMFGSRCEATTTDNLQSDMDIVLCDERLPVVDDLNDAPNSGICLLIVLDSSTAAGYLKLQYVLDGTPMSEDGPARKINPQLSVDNNGRVVRCQDFPFDTTEHFDERNGPAGTTLHVPYFGSSVDQVWAYRCSKWPAFAIEWLTRERQFKWPSPERIDKLRTMGCLVVGAGHPQSPEQLLEWRTSFSLQERDLMLNLNSVQHKCYILMKATKRDMMKPDIDDAITSYQCKTVLFYAIETTPAEFWVSENLVKCFLHCLHALYLCVEQGVCPNYFIPEANLFDRRLHGDLRLRKQVANMLQALLQENGRFLFRITCDDIGRQMSAASNPQEYASTIESMSTKYGQIANKVKYRRYLGVGNNVVIAVNAMLSHAALTNDTSDAIDTMENQLYQLAIKTKVTEHTVEQTREAIDLILPLLHTSVSSHMASRLLSMPHGSTEVENIRAAVGEHAHQTSISEIISCRLKVATIHYMLGEYEASECTLSDVCCAFLPFVANVCACSNSEPHINDLLLSEISSGELSHSDVLKSCLSYCVSFLPTEMEATPTAMRYEMFKAVGTPEETRTEMESEWYEWGIVDGHVLLHYLQYLVYNEKDDGQRKRLAVEQLEDVAVSDATLYHRETAYNLLAWIHTREGDIRKAARCLLVSIRMQPVHNAAKWHIGELYLRTSLSARQCPESTVIYTREGHT